MLRQWFDFFIAQLQRRSQQQAPADQTRARRAAQRIAALVIEITGEAPEADLVRRAAREWKGMTTFTASSDLPLTMWILAPPARVGHLMASLPALLREEIGQDVPLNILPDAGLETPLVFVLPAAPPLRAGEVGVDYANAQNLFSIDADDFDVERRGAPTSRRVANG